jgi:alanyl aminopeptidase
MRGYAALFVLAACGGGSTYPEYSAAEGRAMTPRGEAPARADETVPDGPLPDGVTPLGYTLWMEVVPNRDRFRGRVDIRVRVDAPRRLIWLHGRDVNVTEAEILPDGAEPIVARYRQENDDGAASLRTSEEIPAGEAILSLTYDAPFDRQLKGLYRVDTGGESYAFTQFEATSARLAFPCFDEPRWKTPFDLTLSVLPGHEAIANTSAASTREVGDMKEVRFATTEPITTYLVAMAVGPLDIVDHAAIPANDVRDRAIPFRGVAARGQGARLAYALEHTAPLLAWLESYFGIPYPYDKLDIIAVPDFASGAMENVGAITFREALLLLDTNAPEEQRRDFAYVMAHELAHMWFGNLVTMPWWDDIWLNEAFATWMGNKTVRHVHPEYHADEDMIASVHRAMRADSLTNARQIRQPIESTHDIRNAFDSITYVKGGGVLEMFERFVGEDTFRDGVREYLNAHRFRTATSDDFLDAISRTAGRDIGTPFRTFLMQPGVPLVSASCADGTVTVRQTRYFPIGSAGDAAASWQLPVCVRHANGSTCELVTGAEGAIPIEGGCPSWWMPNAHAAGYYRWSMPAADVDTLMRSGWSRLSVRERLSVVDNLIAGHDADTIDAAVVLAAMPRAAQDNARAVATAPMSLASFTRSYVVPEGDRTAVERWAASLYSARARRLGWTARRNEDGEAAILRASVLSFLAFTARDARTRRDAADRGRRYVGFGGDGAIHADVVPADLSGVALSAAVQEGDAAFFDHVVTKLFESNDALFRSEALWALGATHDPALGQRALELSLDSRLRVNEVTETLSAQMSMPETRARAWAWLRENFDRVFARVATTRAGWAPWLTASFCSEEAAAEVEAFFGPRIEALPGGPRNMRGALEAIRLCVARVGAQRESAVSFFD